MRAAVTIWLCAVLAAATDPPFPRLNALLKDVSLPLPDMTIKEAGIVDLSVTHLIASTLSVETIALELVPSSADVRVVKVSVGGIGVVIDAKFAASLGALPLGSGTVNAVATGSSLELAIAIRGTDFVTGPVQGSRPRTVFAPTSVTTDTSAGGDCASSVKISSIKFTGGLLPDLLNVVKGLVEGLLQTQVAAIICTDAASLVNVNASEAVAQLFAFAKPLLEARAPLPAALPPHWYPKPPAALSQRGDLLDWGATPAVSLFASALGLFGGKVPSNTIVDFLTKGTGRVTLDLSVAPPTLLLSDGSALAAPFDIIAALGLDPALDALDALLLDSDGLDVGGVHLAVESVAPLALSLSAPISPITNITLRATVHNLTLGGIDTLSDDIGLLEPAERVAISPLLRTIWQRIEAESGMEVEAHLSGGKDTQIFNGALDVDLVLSNTSIDIAAIVAVLERPFRALTLQQAVGAESAACIIPTRVFANISRLLVDGVAGADVLTIAPSAALFSPDMAALITSALRLATTLAGQLIVDFAGGVVSGPLNNAVNAFLARAAPSGAKECPPAAQIPSPEDTPLASRQLVNWGNSSIVAALSKLANAEQLNALAAALFPGPPGRGAMIANGTVVSINYTDHFHGGVPATLVIADLEVHGLNSLYNVSLLKPIPPPAGGYPGGDVPLSADPRYTRNTIFGAGLCSVAGAKLPMAKATARCNPLEAALTLRLELHPEYAAAASPSNDARFLRAMGRETETGAEAAQQQPLQSALLQDEIRLEIAATNVHLELDATILVDVVAVQALNFGSLLDIDLNCLFAPLVLVPGVVPVPVLKPSFEDLAVSMECNPCKDEQLESIADYLHQAGTQQQITDILHELLATEGKDIQDDLNSLLTTNLAAFARACQNDAPFNPASASPSAVSPTTVAVVCSALAILLCLGSGAAFLFLMRRRQILAISQHDGELEGSLLVDPSSDPSMRQTADGGLRRVHSAGDLDLGTGRSHSGDGGGAPYALVS